MKWRGGKVETSSKYCSKILQIINKLMNFVLNNALISLNTAPMPQNIFFMIIEIKACADNADTVDEGGAKSGKTCWCNAWTLP